MTAPWAARRSPTATFISPTSRAKRAHRPGRRALRWPRHPDQQRRHPPRPHAHQHERGRVGIAVIKGAPGARSARPATPPPYWRERAKAGETNDARVINTSSASGIYGNVGQTNYGGQGRHRRVHHHREPELGRYGVTVNAIAPAALTRMTGASAWARAPRRSRSRCRHGGSPDRHLAGQPRVEWRHRASSTCRAGPSDRRGLAHRSVGRPSDDPTELGRWWPS